MMQASPQTPARMLAGPYLPVKVLAWAQGRWWSWRGHCGVHLWQRMDDRRWRAVAIAKTSKNTP
jgi:hypothetical protein